MIDTLVGGMVKVPALNVVDHGFNPWSGQIKDFKYDIYYFSKKTTLWSKSKDRLTLKGDNVSE